MYIAWHICETVKIRIMHREKRCMVYNVKLTGREAREIFVLFISKDSDFLVPKKCMIKYNVNSLIR